MPGRPLRAAIALATLACALSARAFFPVPPAPSSFAVVEYLNEFTGHYLLVADWIEMARIAAGAAGPGWRRTGHRFGETWTGPDPTDAPVCRFYSPANNSHFFTANPSLNLKLYKLLKKLRGWPAKAPAA